MNRVFLRHFCIKNKNFPIENLVSFFFSSSRLKQIFSTKPCACICTFDLTTAKQKNRKEVFTDLIKHSDNIEISLSFTKHEHFIWTCPTPLNMQKFRSVLSYIRTVDRDTFILWCGSSYGGNYMLLKNQMVSWDTLKLTDVPQLCIRMSTGKKCFSLLLLLLL